MKTHTLNVQGSRLIVLKLMILVLSSVAGLFVARAGSLTWDPGRTGGSGGTGTWDLNTTLDWWNGSADVTWMDNSADGTNTAVFSGTSGTVTLDTSLSASNLQFQAAGYTLSGSGTLTLGVGGIDASGVTSGTTAIGTPLSLATGQQSWLVGSGGTLAIDGAITRSSGATVDFTASGTTSTTLANANGILGGWATVGGANSTGGDWAANDGSGNIITYTNYTDVSGQTTNGAGASAQNWENATATTTLSASATINSLNQLNDFTVNAGCTLTLGSGGLIMGSVSRWMIAGSSSTSFLESGTASGELFVHVPDSGSGGNWTIWPLVADNGTTPLILVKDGAGLVKMADNNSYTGGTIVNAGTLAARCAVSTGATTQFGAGNITVNSGAQLELGTDVGNAFSSYHYPNNVSVNGGGIFAWDSSQRVQGNLNIGPAGLSVGSTFDAPYEALSESNFPKALFFDGFVTGTGPLTVEDSPYGQTGNPWNTSCAVFTSSGTAAQNTYSGNITVNPLTVAGSGGCYLYLVGPTVMANATITLTGDNLAASGRMGTNTLLFGNGTLDGPGYCTIGGLAGSGDVLLNDTILYSGTPGYSNGIPVALTVGNNNSSTTYSGILNGAGSLIKTGTGTLTLSGVNSYSGNTVVNLGTLAFTAALPNSTNISVSHGGTLDVSALASATLSGGQNLLGAGTINGSLNTSAGSAIYADNGSGYGTNAFNNNLTLGSGALVYFNLGDSATGSNDLITVGGTLTANNNIIHLRAPSTSDSLQATDYTLITSPTPISGTFSGIVWDVAPVNYAHYYLAVSGGTLTLKYSATSLPTGSGSATPSTLLRNGIVNIAVTTTNGSGGTVTKVTVDASPIGGSSTLSLINAGGDVWTNSIPVGPGTLAGSKVLDASITDTVPLTGVVVIPLNVNVGNDVWNGSGADNNFSTGLNWTNGLAPGYVGDSLEFAGSTQLAPNMNNNYTVTGLIFDTGAGSFNIASTTSSTLTLSGNALLVNNSANPQTLNVPIADAGSGLRKGGPGLLTLAGANTYTGPTIVNAGTLNLSGSIASVANLLVGNAAGTSAFDISGTISPYYMLAGNVSNAVTAIYQTGGTVTATTNSGYDNLSLGNVGGSYGYYAANGGSANIGGIAVAGEDNTGGGANFSGNGGNGIMDINGANVTCSGWFVVSRCANPQIGVVNLYSGSLTYAGGGLICNWGSGQTTMINVMGGSLSTTAANEIGFLGGKGIINLLGGVTSVSAINGGFNAGNRGQVGFNGGTLQASVSTAQLLAVTTATIYSGGATIDNNGNTIGLGQSLLAATGNGVSAVTSFTGGAGYIAPPIVIITPGSGDTTGTGATAVAQINPATGTVTNILITCPGVNYTATPTFNFSGGGAVTQASVTGVTLAANTDGGLTSIGGGILAFTNANTYTGPTLVKAGTLYLSPGGSINNSTNIVTSAGAIFDVSTITYTLGGNQALSGFGNVNGPVNTSAGSKIYAGTDGTYGTNTFNSDLTLASGAACYLDLGTAYNGNNDQLVVDGTLTANGNVLHIKAPSTSSSLDTAADYVLITAGTISGTFASAPAWDVAPVNAGHYTVVTTTTNVTLHYNAAVSAPTVAASANPSTVVRNQPFVVTANVTPGNAAISSVTVDLTPLGGSVVSLVQSGASNTYTNTVTVPATANPGGATLTVTAKDTAAQTGSAGVSLSVNASTEVWDGSGGNANWSTNPNWLSGYAPGYAGDTLVFAGSTALAPNMDASYTATGLSFSNNAGGFTIGTANSSTLTLAANGIENDSANTETLNVPISLSATESINAASGNIVLGNTLSGTGGLTKIGNGALTLSGSGSSLGGPLSVNAGSLNVPGGSAAFTGNPSRIGYLTGSASLNLTGGTFSNSGELQVGGSDQNGAGINAVGAVTLTNATLSVGALTIARGNNPLNTMTGTVTLNTGSTLNCEGDCLLDFAGGVIGKMVINGGTLNHATSTKRWLIMSEWDFGNAEFDVNSGQVNINANTDIRFATQGNTGTNTFNLNGGAVTFYADNATTIGGSGVVDMHQGTGTTVDNIFNLNGGTLTVSQILSATTSGTRTFNFNGGTLKATAANASYLSLGSGNTAANVRNGGAIIDDGGFAIGIPQPLQHSTIAGDNAIDGGLTKKGAGTLTLSGGTSYTGNTTVTAGTLELSLATLAADSTVSINSGAVLKLDFTTTNQVAGLVLNGVSEPAGVYNSTTAAPYVTGTGSLVVVAALPPAPTFGKIIVSGGNVIITATNNHGSGGTWTLLGTNILTAPLSNWPVISTGTFNSNGNLALTNAVGTNHEFFILRVP